MADIDTARQQVQEARSQLSQRYGEISQAKEQLSKAESSIPQTSQRMLRGQNAPSGVSGRNYQRQLAESRQRVESAKKDIGEYEEVLKPVESEVSQAESQIKEYDLRNEAIQEAQRLYSDRIPFGFLKGSDFENPYTYDYLKKLYQQENLQREGIARLQSNPELLKQKVDTLMSKGLSEELAYQKLGLKVTEKIPTLSDVTIPSNKQFTVDTSGISSTSTGVNGLNNYRNLFTGMALVSAEQVIKEQAQELRSFKEAVKTPTWAGTNIPLVQRSSNIDLNKVNDIKLNGSLGTSNLVSGMAIGEINKGSSGQQSGNIVSRISNILNSGISQGFQKKEIYSPQLGGFVQANPMTGQFDSSTAVVRPPTAQEQAKIDVAISKGGGAYYGSPLQIPVVALEKVQGYVGQKIENLYPEQSKMTISAPVQYGTLQYTGLGQPIVSTTREITLTREQQAQPFKSLVQTGIGLGALATPYLGTALMSGYAERGIEEISKPAIQKISYSDGEKQGYTKEQVDELNKQIEQQNKLNKIQGYVDIGTAALPLLIKYVPKAVKYEVSGIKSILKSESSGEFAGLGGGGRMGKKGTQQLLTGSGSAEESEYILVNGKYIKKMTQEQALGEFSRASLEKKAEYIRNAFQNRLYLDTAGKEKDLLQATSFIKRSGADIKTAENVLRRTGIYDDVVQRLLKNIYPDEFKVGTIQIQSYGGIYKPLQKSMISMNIETPMGRFEGIKQPEGIFNIKVLSKSESSNIITGGVIKQASSQQPKIITMQPQKAQETTTSIFKSSTKQEQPQESKSMISTLFAQPQASRERVDTLDIESFKQPQEQKERYKSISLTLFKQPQEFTKPQLSKQSQQVQRQKEEPEPIKPKEFSKQKYSSKDLLKSIARAEGFEVFKKVKGRLLKIGEEETPYLAGRTLKRSLLSDISASGEVVSKRTGERVRATELGIDTTFRVSKVSPFRLVQREGKRLSTRGEILGIQQGKRRKSKWL